MRDIEPRNGKSGEIALFNPKQTGMKLGALAKAVRHAAKIKDWETLEKAINDIIAEQHAFIGFWAVHVRSAGGKATQAINALKHELLSVKDATRETGITQPQVSRWGKRLADEDGYRDWLRESAHGPMWALRKDVRGTTGTGENEWFTPAEHVELARKVLGDIDIDPASHTIAQRTIKAAQFFTKADDGLKREWNGRVWLNPPYAQPLIAEFISKCLAEIEAGRTTAAITLTHNYTDTSWFQDLAARANAICFTRGRIRFEEPDGELAAPTQGQAFAYIGDNVECFCNVFRSIGFVVLPGAK